MKYAENIIPTSAVNNEIDFIFNSFIKGFWETNSPMISLLKKQHYHEINKCLYDALLGNIILFHQNHTASRRDVEMIGREKLKEKASHILSSHLAKSIMNNDKLKFFGNETVFGDLEFSLIVPVLKLGE